MAAIYSNGGNRWNILGFNFTKRDALSSKWCKPGHVVKHGLDSLVKHGLDPISKTWTLLVKHGLD